MRVEAELVRVELRAIYDDDPDLSYLEQSDLFPEGKARLLAWQTAEWYCVGLQARAIVRVLNAEFCIDSEAVWGYESDSDTTFIVDSWANIYEELRHRLRNRGFKYEELAMVPIVVESTPENYDSAYYD